MRVAARRARSGNGSTLGPMSCSDARGLGARSALFPLALCPIALCSISACLLASCGAPEQPVRVERAAVSSVADESATARVSVTPEYDRVAFRVTGWWEGCTESSPAPSFVARFDGHVMHVTRAGTASPPACSGDAVCRCEYRLEGNATVPGTGHYRVQVEDGSGIRARGTFDVE